MEDDISALPGDNGNVDGLTMARVGGWLRQVLAFARSSEPRNPPAARAVAVDTVLAIAAVAASVVSSVEAVRGHLDSVVPAKALLIGSAASGAAGRIEAVAVFFAIVTTAPLALRRILPITVFWVVLLGIVFGSQYSNFVTFIAVVLAAYSAVVHSRFRAASLISVLLAGLMVTAAFPDTTPKLPGRFTALLVLIPVVLVGNAMHLWKRRAGDSQARLRRMQSEHEAATRRALAAERARIAAELHDVVTHHVSVMVVQAGAARRVMTASPDDAATALLAVEASGRAAMIELQHLLGLLSLADGVHADGAQLRPQPGLDRLRPLIDGVTATGLQVELTVSGQPAALPAGLDLTAYRVIQEALTNVMKHSGQASTAVRLDYRSDELVVGVSDDGPQVKQPSLPATAGSGRGLLGLRERVSLYGGDVDAGPRPGGGWRVTARLPLESQPADFADGGAAADGGPAPAAASL
ncbi:MAG TPA: ATP-binding protein [Streptosporangiaceae bacterium]|nr:ATP-binding protein [Streptosporangiaceae bacterium]